MLCPSAYHRAALCAVGSDRVEECSGDRAYAEWPRGVGSLLDASNTTQALELFRAPWENYRSTDLKWQLYRPGIPGALPLPAGGSPKTIRRLLAEQVVHRSDVAGKSWYGVEPS